MSLRTCHLFAGAGGGLLADLILGHHPVVAVEWEPYACQVLRERAAEGWFPGLHVFEGDVRLFDPSDYAGIVDCIHAGFPCQDISNAGKQAGVGEGTRSGLYREVLRIAGVVRPRKLFLENVSAILSNGLGTVLGDLAALGYDCRWICLRASDVGAPHHRDRWWCLATMADAEREQDNGVRRDSECGRDALGWNEQAAQQDNRTADHDRSCGCGEVQNVRSDVADAGSDAGDAWRAGNASKGAGRRDAYRGIECADVADATRELPHRTGGAWDGRAEPADCCSENADAICQRLEVEQQGRAAARSTDRPGDGNYSGWWEIEPDVGRVADGVASRVDRLKALGNGQVALQAAVAWKLLGGD